jgi:FeS assembly SUF system regulator
MIRMSKLADYGSVLTTYMARRPLQTVHTAADLATGTRLPAPTVSKILKLLGKAGLLVSQRGVKGGYSLARHPGQITLADIIRALEGGPVSLTDCTSGSHDSCERETECLVSHQWQYINDAVYTALDNISLEEMAYPRRRFDGVNTPASLNTAAAGRN